MNAKNKKLRLLCITRKYPPQVGGMENFSYNLFNGFDEEQVDKKIIALGKKQYHLIWFFPYCLLYVIINAHKYDVVFIGDGVLCSLRFFGKLFAGNTTFAISVLGLDITFKNPVYQLYLKLFYKNFDDYICISKETENTLKARGIKKSTVITPGVDVEKFKYADKNTLSFRKKYGLDNDSLIMITVGRLVRRKGVLWFLENVVSRIKDKNITYLVVGSGEDSLVCEETKAKYQLDRVQLLGRVSDEELESLYVNADIFVMPNIKVENDMEGFGIVALEASLSKSIVIASGIEGIKDAIIDGKNGYLLESQNAEEYIAKILEIYQNKAEYKIFAEKFCQFTKDNYNWEKICQLYITHFKSLSANKRLKEDIEMKKK